MSNWVRLWEDMPDDPKWRVVAKRSGRPLHQVVAVFTRMLVNAGRATVRGTLEGWDDEDEAMALDMDEDAVVAIREAMQGKVLDGDALTGWEKRQPKREDNSTSRVNAFRDRQADLKRTETPRNATQRTETLEERRVEEIREERISPPLLSVAEGAKKEGGERGIFDEFRKGYTDCPGASWLKASQAFDELSDEGQRLAVAYLPTFRKAKTTNPMNPERYIRERVFDNMASGFVPLSDLVLIDQESPEGEAWEAFKRRNGGKGVPWVNKQWRLPTRWPPGHVPSPTHEQPRAAQ